MLAISVDTDQEIEFNEEDDEVVYNVLLLSEETACDGTDTEYKLGDEANSHIEAEFIFNCNNEDCMHVLSPTTLKAATKHSQSWTPRTRWEGNMIRPFSLAF